jgi:hypothetical protein
MVRGVVVASLSEHCIDVFTHADKKPEQAQLLWAIAAAKSKYCVVSLAK